MRVLQVWILFALLCATFVLMRRTRCHVIWKQHFGYLLRSIGQIQLIEGQVRLIFHYKLSQIPSKGTLRRIHCSEYINMTTLRRRYLNFRQVTYSLYKIRADVLTLLTTRLKEINELLATLEKRPSVFVSYLVQFCGNAERRYAYDPRVQYYIAADNFLDIPLKPDSEITTYIDIHDVSIKLQTVAKRSCALALFQNSLNGIKHLCGYKIFFNSLPTSVHHLGADRLLLNNVSHLVLSRKARKNVPPIQVKSVMFTASQVIFQLPCEAIAKVLNYVIYSNNHCLPADNSNTLNVTYVMNMPILRHYFSDDLLRDINSAIHLNSTVRAELPPLFIERPDFLHHVEKEEEFAFDFNKAINASVDDEKLYASLSHLIWSKLITNEYLNTFQKSSAFHWLSVISLALSTFNTLIVTIFF